MMNYIFGALILISVVCSAVTGRGRELTQGVIDGASDSVKLLTTMAGMMLLWSGIMEIAQRGGFTALLGRVLSPVLRRVFKNVPKKSKALSKISMNVSANLLGLGNAATPFGISAMKELRRLSPREDEASGDMVVFVVINTASIQLMPTMIGTLRQMYGSRETFSILPCVWLSSICALAVGLGIAKLFQGRERD
ncbi:MAG: spore maturation protein A [Ruminococcus sp.]|nr:spore maturation protein A [Ruminococcus sp.]